MTVHGSHMHPALAPQMAAALAGAALPDLRGCVPIASRVALLDERMLTRSRLSPDAAAASPDAVALTTGDPRLAALGTLLGSLALEPRRGGEPDVRTLVRVTCADGRSLEIAGGLTGADGAMLLSVNGVPALTRSPLRRWLDGLLRGR